MRFPFFYFSLLALTCSIVCTTAAPSVTTFAGNLQGTSCSNSNASAFLSIPYALPPIGNLRFAPPVAYNESHMSGIINTISSAPACLQFGAEFIESGPQSENCLYLDVWAPPITSNGTKLPVKFWLYGGSDTAGGISDPLYDGCNLAGNGDSVVVAVNYRLGPLGWFSVPDIGIGGNFGLQDILLALEWVQSNIGAFGGDPEKVLLFGQSAGASNSYIISTLPQAHSLINSVILESGGGRSYAMPPAANAYSAKYAAAINCSTSDITCFRSASIETLNSTVATASEEIALRLESGGFYTGWGPFVDGKIIPADPGVVGPQVPALFGSNTEEGTLFVIGFYGFGISNLTAANYTTFLQHNFGNAASTIEQYYPVSAFNTTPLPTFFAMQEIYTLVNYECSNYRGMMAAARRGIPVWTYRSNHTLTCPWNARIPDTPQILSILGPTHSSEIPLVFANTRNLPLPNGNCTLNSQEQTISAQLVAAWTAMAASGNPSTSLMPWPAWNASASLGINIQNSTSVAPIDFTACRLFDIINQAELNATVSGANSTTGKPSNSIGMPGATSITTMTSPSATATSNGIARIGVEANAALTMGLGLLGAFVFV